MRMVSIVMRRRSREFAHSKYVRKGIALYVTVLSTALIVSLLILTGLSIVRIERRQLTLSRDLSVARMHAKSAVNAALVVIAKDPNWRTIYTNGIETPPKSLHPNLAGTLSWILEDTDGSLEDADTNLRLKGIGRVGNTVQVSSVKVTTSGAPLSCLEVAVCAGSNVNVDYGTSVLTSNQVVAANESVRSSGMINADVEAVQNISGSGYSGKTLTGVAARALPGLDVFDYYIANGTHISYDSLPKGAQNSRQITKAVLSPANNPFGTGQLNTQGIYVIDCGGGRIYIQGTRLVGTLVLLNPAPESSVVSEVHFAPALPNLPTLLVRGDIIIRPTSSSNLEESRLRFNFNPVGTPFNGNEDSDQIDVYPSLIRGLVYISGSVQLWDDPVIDGVLVVGSQVDLNPGAVPTVNHDSIFLSQTPPGFSGGAILKAMPGTWFRDAAL